MGEEVNLKVRDAISMRFNKQKSIKTRINTALFMCAVGLQLLSANAYAGAQKEETLALNVQTALAAAVSDEGPRKINYENIEDRIRYLNWLGDMSERLAKRRREMDKRTRIELLETIYYESKRAGLEPSLVLGLIQVESNFRKYAISSASARGYMQVMPFWTKLIGDGDVRKLFHMQSNLRFGCTILRHYINLENGNLFLALGRYNGSRGRDPYPNAVLAAWNNWR
jgi:soluble lytic murein transglycosylase-like protein